MKDVKYRSVETRMKGWEGAFYPLNLRKVNDLYFSHSDLVALVEGTAKTIHREAKVRFDIQTKDLRDLSQFVWPYGVEIPGQRTYLFLFPPLDANGHNRSIALFSNGPSSIKADSQITTRLFLAMKRA